MKTIIKQGEPSSLTTFRNLANDNWEPNWNNLSGAVKLEVHRSLLDEQGGLCCYCEMRVDARSSHIEHLHPRNRPPESFQLDYQNLLASCQREQRPKQPLHCGMRKRDWYDPGLMISPLTPTCESHFRFTADGIIRPQDSHDLAAKETIKRLGLDIDKLNALRGKSIEAVIEHVGDPSFDEDLPKLIAGFQQRDSTGQFSEFCTAIVSVLSSL